MPIQSTAVSSYSVSTSSVTARHFGANAVPSVNTEDGTPIDTFAQGLTSLRVTDVRYPAGQVEDLFENGMLDASGTLIAPVVNFLDWARADNRAVSFVLPVEAGFPGAAEMSAFVAQIMEHYGDVVRSFEIGNEYWGYMGETAYGQIAETCVQAVLEGAGNAADRPEIIVQMGNPAGGESEFSDAARPDTGWADRIEGANTTIIDQLSDSSLSALSGVVEHYYYKRTEDDFTNSSDEMASIDLKHAVWAERLGRDIDLHLTEWNISARNHDQLGMKGASTLLEQFQNIVTMGVDAAQAWPIQHNTTNDLAGPSGSPLVIDPDTGVATNTVLGTMFGMMSRSLVGTSAVDAQFTNDDGSFEINAFSGGEKVVVYVSSRISDKIDLDIDLSGLIPNYASVTGYRIGYDAEGSDGVFYNNRYNAATDPAEDKWLAAETVQIDGEDYCLNEHDARGKVTALTSDAFLADAHVSFSLLPYQVVELTYTVPAGRGGGDETLRGTSGADTLRGTAGGDRIDAGGGNDLVRALGGADEVLAGLGNDRVFAGAGDDTVHGGTGRDRLIGGQGDDTLHGEGGNDRLVGGGGSDTLIGGAGRDRLIGGSGKDTMTGGEGADHFVFKVRDISWGETVTDFTVGVDVLVFQGITNLSADDLKIYRNDAIDGFSIGFSKLDLQGSIHLQGTGDLDWKIVAAATNFEFM